MNVPDVEPPAYTPSSARGVRHRFPLLDKRGKQWGILTLESGARSANSTPLFYEDDTIYGSFETEIEKGDSIRSVTVKVTGAVITGPMVDDRMQFLKVSTCLWARQNATPDAGRFFRPFSIPLPSEVASQSDGQPSTLRLPESFLERHTRATVLYEVSLTVSRGLFRPDSYFKTRFRYVPCTRPDAPSALRQRAYRLNRPLRGPANDPAGWKTSTTAMSHGHVFRTRQAVVQCTLSLARPLFYTRGSVIPCFLTLSSGDPDALELHAAPTALTVHLRRRVRYAAADRPTLHSVAGAQESLAVVARAAWWPRDAGSEDEEEHTRTLEGEVRLPPELAASADMGSYSISYTVDVLPPDCVGFTPTGSGNQVLISVQVEIATMYAANAQRPVAYAPPSYDDDAFAPHEVAGPSTGVIYTSGSGVNMGR
ncbi:hypothetical protein B0H19DRAFT_1382759 [Mycena capillaripes]|nr:hypothetical protein B0H19DRAFT_1382759 [Mycena capillaripes]